MNLTKNRTDMRSPNMTTSNVDSNHFEGFCYGLYFKPSFITKRFIQQIPYFGNQLKENTEEGNNRLPKYFVGMYIVDLHAQIHSFWNSCQLPNLMKLHSKQNSKHWKFVSKTEDIVFPSTRGHSNWFLI